LTIERRLDDRLARVEAARAARAKATVRPGAEHRSALRAKAAIGAVIREALLLTGVDLQTCRALGLAQEAQAELAAIPDTPALRRADKRLLGGSAGDRSNPAADAFEAKVSDLVHRYRAGLGTPDFPTESMACVFAWSLAMLQAHAAPRTGRRRC
jgi:hypothetical protein